MATFELCFSKSVDLMHHFLVVREMMSELTASDELSLSAFTNQRAKILELAGALPPCEVSETVEARMTSAELTEGIMAGRIFSGRFASGNGSFEFWRTPILPERDWDESLEWSYEIRYSRDISDYRNTCDEALRERMAAEFRATGPMGVEWRVSIMCGVEFGRGIATVRSLDKWVLCRILECVARERDLDCCLERVALFEGTEKMTGERVADSLTHARAIYSFNPLGVVAPIPRNRDETGGLIRRLKEWSEPGDLVFLGRSYVSWQLMQGKLPRRRDQCIQIWGSRASVETSVSIEVSRGERAIADEILGNAREIAKRFDGELIRAKFPLVK